MDRYFLISGVLAVIGLAFIGYASVETKRELEDRAAQRQAFKQRMVDQGCKVTEFAGQYAYPVYTCPDGHVEMLRSTD